MAVYDGAERKSVFPRRCEVSHFYFLVAEEREGREGRRGKGGEGGGRRRGKGREGREGEEV